MGEDKLLNSYKKVNELNSFPYPNDSKSSHIFGRYGDFFYRKLIYSYDKIVLPLCELFNTKKYYFNVQQVYNLTSLTYSYLYL